MSNSWGRRGDSDSGAELVLLSKDYWIIRMNWGPGHSYGRPAGSYSKTREENIPESRRRPRWKRGWRRWRASILRVTETPGSSLFHSVSSPWRVTSDLTTHTFVSVVGFLVGTENSELQRTSFSEYSICPLATISLSVVSAAHSQL